MATRLPPRFDLVPAEPRGEVPPPSKNRIAIGQARDGRRVLVKTPGAAGPTGIRREGEVLGVLGRLTAGRACPLRVPAVHAFDGAGGALAVRWAEGAETLHAFHQRTGRYSASLGAAIGRALGWLHGQRLAGPDPTPSGIPCDADFAEFFTHLSPAAYSRLSRAGIDLIAAVQQDRQAMAALVATARHPGGARWLHGDLKPANILRLPGTRPRLMLVDWERSVQGDPARDLGTLLAEYLALEPGDRPLAAGKPQGLVAGLLAAYRAERGIGDPPEPDFAARVVRWSGIGLLYHVYAYVHHDGAFDARGRHLVACATALLARPEGGLAERLLPVR